MWLEKSQWVGDQVDDQLTDGWNGCDDFTELQLVENRCKWW